jgi:hypothetical protein
MDRTGGVKGLFNSDDSRHYGRCIVYNVIFYRIVRLYIFCIESFSNTNKYPYMYKFVLLLSFCCFIASCKSDPTIIDPKAYEEQKQNLADKEQSKPLAFLHVKSACRKNWIGQTVVEGTISNHASITSYKNIRLKMLCFDKTDKIVEEHEDELDAIVKPNTSKDFKLRYRLPRITDSIGVSIMSAAVHE